MSARRRPKLAKSVDSVMQFVEAEMARTIAADPSIAAARQRAIRRAGRPASRQGTGHALIASH